MYGIWDCRAIMIMLQERFEAESALSATHGAQVQAGWRAVMRMASVAGMREEVEVLAEQHER